MRGSEVIKTIRGKLARSRNAPPLTNTQLAHELGLTPMSLSYWKRREKITPLQVANLVVKASDRARRAAEFESIRPIVEFFDLDPADSMHRARFELFDVGVEGSTEGHPYLVGLKRQLQDNHGIYIFYDSRGRALYVGKARRLSLWTEMNNAYNRNREVQKIKRVQHPVRRQRFRTSDEQKRQIVPRSVQLHELVAYMSAYEVSDGLIGELEALLVRGFANDLSNVRMEHFARHRKPRVDGKAQQIRSSGVPSRRARTKSR